MNGVNLRMGLATSAIALTLAGCSTMGELPGASMVSSGYRAATSWIPGMGSKPESPRATVRTASNTNAITPPMPSVPPDSGDAPLSVAAGQGGTIVDSVSRCATSNNFANPEETIRWFGACKDGRLDGQGTLIWYVKGIETERNVGVFRGGEFDGEVVTTYPDGQVVVGSYRNGVRSGEFTVVKADGGHVRANYQAGTLVAQRDMSVSEVEGWRRQRGASGGLLAQVAANPPQATAATSAANQRVVTAAVQPTTAVASVARDEPVMRPASMTGLAPVETPRSAQPAVVSAPRIEPAPATQVAMIPPPAPALPPMATPALMAPAAPLPPMAQPAVLRAPARGEMATLADQYAGRDGPWVISSGTARPAATLASMTTSTPAAPVLRPPAQPAASRAAPPARTSAPPVLRPPAGGDDVRSVAAQYAGQDGPWVIAASPASSQMAQVLRASDTLPAPVFVSAAQPMQPAPQRMVAPAPLPAPQPQPTQMAALPNVAPAAAMADTLFAQAYQLEMAGRFFEAERAYESVLMNYPSAPSAQLANMRLNGLRQSVRAAAVPVPATPAAYAAQTSDAPVISVNTPMPTTSAALQAGRGSSNNPSLSLQSELINREVCTQEGIYGSDARWCGFVRFDEGDFLRVEVRDVKLPSFGQIGITRSACTGNTFVTWFSRGTSLRVPKRCMTVVG